MQDVKNLSDERLVNLVRNSDQELYREVVRRFQDKLLRYATYLVRDEAQAADVVQQSFIKAFINLHGFNTKKKFSSWLYRIVHNEAINLLKKYRKEISLSLTPSLENQLKSPHNPETNLARKEVKKLVKKSLNQLPLKYRSPLTLFYLEGKTYEEISDILRLPLGTVATHINRGKKLALAVLKANGGEAYV